MIKLKELTVSCRKPHPCCWCGEIIGTGEEAVYRAYLHDGFFQNDWTHPECFDAAGKLADNDPLEDLVFDAGDFKRGSMKLKSE